MDRRPRLNIGEGPEEAAENTGYGMKLHTAAKKGRTEIMRKELAAGTQRNSRRTRREEKSTMRNPTAVRGRPEK
jgi:hypothetical protein